MLWKAALGGVAVLCVVMGLDLLTGSDPAVMAAEYPEVEIGRVADSTGLYRRVSKDSGARAYFTLAPRIWRLTDGERLTARLETPDCGAFLPKWLPIFPKAPPPACLLARTNLALRKSFASFLIDVDDVRGAIDFYDRALTGFEALRNGTVVAAGDQIGDLNAIIDYRDEKSGRRVTIRYFLSRPGRRVVVVAEFEGKV